MAVYTWSVSLLLWSGIAFHCVDTHLPGPVVLTLSYVLVLRLLTLYMSNLAAAAVSASIAARLYQSDHACTFERAR